MKELLEIERRLDELNNDFIDLSNINKINIIDFLNGLKALLFPKTYKKHITIKRLYIELYEILSNINIQNSNEIVDHFFEDLPSIKIKLLKDLNKYLEKDPAARLIDEVVFSYNSFQAIFIYRISNVLEKLNVPIIPRFLSEYAHSITGIDIHPACSIGESFFIDHGTGIVIGETTVIGNNVSIYQGVTLGAKSLKNGKDLKGIKRHPTICNNVVIYANATILGGNTVIKENSIIPGNAFIIDSN